MGTRQAAQALVTLAVDGGRGRGVSEQSRHDALLALAAWSPPSSRDRVTGLWHPVPTASRDAPAARDLLGPAIRRLLAARSGDSLDAAITAAAALELDEAAPALSSLVASRANPPPVRLRALRALASLSSPSSPELSQSLNQASNDPALPVRLEALALKVKVDPARALDVARATLAGGSVREKQLAVRIVADTAGPAADDVLARLAADLLAGVLPPELTLDVLDAAARRKQAPALAAAVARFEAQRSGTISVRTGRPSPAATPRMARPSSGSAPTSPARAATAWRATAPRSVPPWRALAGAAGSTCWRRWSTPASTTPPATRRSW